MSVALLLVGAASVVALQQLSGGPGRRPARRDPRRRCRTHAPADVEQLAAERLRDRRAARRRARSSTRSRGSSSRMSCRTCPATCRPGPTGRATTSPSTAADHRSHWRVKVSDLPGPGRGRRRGSVRCGLRRRPPDPHRESGRHRRPARPGSGQRVDGAAEPAPAGGHRAHGGGDRGR